MEKATPVIQIDHLNKFFSVDNNFFTKGKRTVKAVNNVTLTINKGEIMGLAGESGSGKTTLARVILNLTKPTGGTVLINDIDLSKASNAEKKRIRKEVAVVFQDPASNLNPRDTVEGSIIRPLIIHGMSRTEAKTKAVEALYAVKMDKRYLYSYPHQLSGGQLQRIAENRRMPKRGQHKRHDEHRGDCINECKPNSRKVGKGDFECEKNNGRNKPHQPGGHQRYDTALQLRSGTVALSMLFSQKVVNRYAEQFRKHDKNKNIGNTVRSLPFGDGFIRIVDFFGKLRLGKVAFTPVAHNVFGNDFFYFFIISNYHETILQQ